MRLTSALLGTATAMMILAGASSALAAEGFAREPGQLRAGPDNDYPSLIGVTAGVGLQVYDCIEGYNWCDVSVQGQRGWFPGNRIELLHNGNRVVITQAGREVGVNVVSFSINTYWQEHYTSRPFFHETRWYSRAGVQPPKAATTNTNVNINNNTTNIHESTTTETRKATDTNKTKNVNENKNVNETKTKTNVDETKTKETKTNETRTKEPAKANAEPQKKPANADTETQPNKAKAAHENPKANTEAPAKAEPEKKPACPVGKTC